MDETAVGDVGGTVGAEDVGDVDGEGAKIEAASKETGDRHNDVIDERIDDGGKGATNGDTDSEVDDATAVDEFFELVDKVVELARFLGGFFCTHNIYYSIVLSGGVVVEGLFDDAEVGIKTVEDGVKLGAGIALGDFGGEGHQ